MILLFEIIAIIEKSVVTHSEVTPGESSASASRFIKHLKENIENLEVFEKTI